MTIYLDGDKLVFDHSDYHPRARLAIDFQRTLRIPDDGKEYFLPPGLGRFPLRHVEDYEPRLPDTWVRRGGVIFPMYQAEAMWLHFDAGGYPFAVKVASGKINAVTGEPWSMGLNRDPQDYMVAPRQPWLDGFCVEKGLIRQFVAMPLGKGYTAEEQLSGEATWGGLQVIAYPMKKDVYESRFLFRGEEVRYEVACLSNGMGLAPGGRMHQEIYQDPNALCDWDQRKGERCFIAILNSQDWRAVTGENVPSKAVSAKDYAAAGLPWFDYYSDLNPVPGSGVLAKLQGLRDKSASKGEHIPELNDAIPPTRVIRLGSRTRGTVRAGEF